MIEGIDKATGRPVRLAANPSTGALLTESEAGPGGGSTSPPVDANGDPLDWPWQQTITDGTEYVLTWAAGRGAPLTVWKGAGDTIEVAKRDGDGQDWDVLVNDNLTWSSDLVEGVVYQVRFRRTSGAGSTVVGARG